MMQRSRLPSKGCWAGFRTRSLTCPSQTSIKTGRMAKHSGLSLTAVLQVSPLVNVSLPPLLGAALLCMEGEVFRAVLKEGARLSGKLQSKEASCGKQHVINDLAKRNTGLKQNGAIALLEVLHLSLVLGVRDKGTSAGSRVQDRRVPTASASNLSASGCSRRLLVCS